MSKRAPHGLHAGALSASLHGAARAVAAVAQGTALPQALAAVFAQSAATAPARGAIQDIAYHCMRRMGYADGMLEAMTNRSIQPLLLQALLRCALALLAADGDESPRDESPRYEPFTVVDQCVHAAAADPATAHAKGMVNAVLRRFLRERRSLEDQVLARDPARWNYPAWWIDACRFTYPDAWPSILSTGNAPPPLTLRVNRRRTTIADYLDLLARHDMAATQVGPAAIRLARPAPVASIPGFAAGLVSVQDAAAQLAAPLLDLADGMHVLDACAAPGGKTGHILETADVTLTALDSDARRLARVDDNLRRLQLAASLQTGDAAAVDWWDGRRFDRILADVPCTASGIVRRHPDIRWLRRPDDAVRLATVSAGILDNLWQMLQPNGKLLLVTCSIWPQESEAQAAAFASRNKATRLPAPGQLLPTAGDGTDHDGLFYALFEKSAE